MNKPIDIEPDASHNTASAGEGDIHGQDADVNREHRGGAAYENSAPGTPGNVEGLGGEEARPGQEHGSGAAPAGSRTEAEQSTVSSPSGDSTAK